MDAQCISNTTRVCLKASEKHFFLLSPALPQAAQDTPSTGPTTEDIHQLLNMRAPPKTHPVVRPIQLNSWGAMDAPPGTRGVHIVKHRDIWWTVEWEDHGKVRRAAAHASDDQVPPPPRGGDRLRLAARVPHSREAAWEALHYALYWAQGAPVGPLPSGRTTALTRHATRCTAPMRRHGADTGQRFLTWPTNSPDAPQAAEETVAIMTNQVFQLKDAVPTSKPDVPATGEHPVFAPGHAPAQQPQSVPPQQVRPTAQRCEGAKKRKAPTRTKAARKPKARRKSWTQAAAAALYPEYAIGT